MTSGGATRATIGAMISPDGEARFDQAAAAEAEACARGDVGAWLGVLLDGSLDGIDGAADETVGALFASLHTAAAR